MNEPVRVFWHRRPKQNRCYFFGAFNADIRQFSFLREELAGEQDLRSRICRKLPETGIGRIGGIADVEHGSGDGVVG